MRKPEKPLAPPGQYAGLVVGGPDAGRMIVMDKPTYEVAVHDPGALTVVADAPPVEVGAKLTHHLVRYRHHVALRGGFEIDLWVLEPHDLAWALETVFSVYCASAPRMKEAA